MSVTNYNNTCKYHIGKLDNVIFLITEEASKDIIIDNGAAYISGITEQPLAINCYNIKVEETDELDERYKFTHSVSFSVNGYLNHLDLDNRFYAIVRDSEGTYWMINPMFSSKVTYTYTLNATNSFTNFVMATASNHPILKVVDFEASSVRDCGYFHCTLKDLRLNESKYSRANNGTIKYTNDGFKTISFNRNSAIFTETFNGDDISHEIDFSIPFDDYKSSWHYNLLEFQDNLYSAIIGTTCGKYIITGFHHGLQPSFSVSADDDMKMNTIDISMSDLHDNGKFIEYVDDVTFIYESGKTYVNTTEYDAWDCVSKNTAKYILRQEVDAFQNPTGLYKCLEGYESRFAFLGDALVGTFSDVVTFNNPSCGGDSCELDTSIPSTIEFTSSSVKRYSLLSDTNWSITNNDPNITIAPTSGNAHQAYTITIANSYTANTATTFTISYCNTSRTVNVNVDTTSSCFPAGNHFTITAEGQYVTIPIKCCAKAVNASVVTRIQITSSSIKVFVPMNESGASRDIPLEVVWCDDSTSSVIITQTSVYERWVTEGQVCVGNQKCDFQRRYTGTSASDINTRTNVTRTTNCVASSECGSSTQRWIDVSGYTYCNNDKLYQVQKEQVSSDGGQTWTDTGIKRLGLELEDIGNTCSGLTYEYRWLLTLETTCVGYNKYNLYIKQRRVSGTSTWEEVIPTTKSYNGNGDVLPHLVEQNSRDCGYIPPVTPTYEWRLVSGYICDECSDTQYRWYTVSYDCQGYDKYAHQKKQFSNDGTTWTDVIPEETQDVIAEYNSEDCGYIEPQYRWVRSGYTCVGYDVYENNIRQYSNDSGVTWQNVIPEQYSASTLVEHNSESCGYVPSAETQYRWYTIPNSNYCDGYDEHAQQKRQYSNDSGVTWEDMIPLETQNILISGNSTNCGYMPPSGGVKWVADYENYPSSSADCTSYMVGTIRQYDIDAVKYEVPEGEGLYTAHTLSSVTVGECVTSLSDYAFYRTDCGIFTLPSGITSIGDYGFYQSAVSRINSENNGELILPEELVRIGARAFYDCHIIKVVIPDKTESIGAWAFHNCDYLLDVEIGSGITTISDNAFENSENLRSIIIKAETPPALGRWAFDNTGNCPIYVPQNAVSAYQSAWSQYASRIQPIPEPSSMKWSATYSGGSVITAACDSTSAITYGEINNLPRLATVQIGSCVTSIGNGAFYNTNMLSTITFGNNVVTIGWGAFSGCTSLQSLVLPNSLTTIDHWAFSTCRSLTSVTFGNSVTSIGNYAFENCSSLLNVTIPTGVTTIGTSMFNGCTSLTSVTIPNSVTEIGGAAFENCTSLQSITIPDSVTSIGNSTFKDCSGLTSAYIGNGFESVGNGLFWGCTSLETVTIGSGCTSLGNQSFLYCYSLTSLTIYATNPPSIGGGAFNAPNLTIYVPAQSVQTYKNDTWWSDYADRIQPIT